MTDAHCAPRSSQEHKRHRKTALPERLYAEYRRAADWPELCHRLLVLPVGKLKGIALRACDIGDQSLKTEQSRSQQRLEPHASLAPGAVGVSGGVRDSRNAERLHLLALSGT